MARATTEEELLASMDESCRRGQLSEQFPAWTAKKIAALEVAWNDCIQRNIFCSNLALTPGILQMLDIIGVGDLTVPLGWAR